MTVNLLQERINELDSAIINIVADKIHLTGFFNEKRLMSHLEEGMDNWRSKGLYDCREMVFTDIRSNALFLVMKDGKVIDKHKYIVYKRKTVERKDKPGPLILTVRKHEFTEQWQINVSKQTYNFISKQELKGYLLEHYRFDFEL